MVAASRRPRLRPCAPIGGNTCAASPISATRLRAEAARGLDRQRKHAAAGLDRRSCPGSNASAARSRPRAPRRKARRGAAASAGSTTQTRLERRPGSGTSVNGPVSVWNSVEVSSVRPAWREIEGQRGLRIGRGRRLSMPAAARQSERRPSAPIASRADTVAAVCSVTVTSVVVDLDRRRLRRRSRASAGSSRGARLERGEEMAVLDIVAESVEPDLARRQSRPRAPARAAPVSSTMRITRKRRGLLAAARPDAERLERRDRAGEQRGGAVVGRGGRLATSAVSTPGRRERDRRGQAGRPAADHDHFGGQAVMLPSSHGRSSVATTRDS